MTDKKQETPEAIILSSDKFGQVDPGEIDIKLSNSRPRMLIDNSIFSSSSTAYRGRKKPIQEKERVCCFPF